MTRRLRDKDIENLLASLENGDISEDDAGIDENELNYYSDVHDLIRDLDEEPEEDLNDDTADFTPVLEEENPSYDSASTHSLPGSSSGTTAGILGVAAWKARSRNVIWKKRSLPYNKDQILFTGNSELPPKFVQLETPYQFFSEYIDDTILTKIVAETNLYITQKGVSNCPPTTHAEIRQFLGIIIFMSVFHYPSVRSYWGKYGFKNILETMPLNRFEKLRSVLHFNDNSLHKPVGDPGHDRLHKIRPIVEHFNSQFKKVPFEQRLSLDEQMCATKIGHYMKQYLPNKPHKWGFKLYVICSLAGYAYNFEIYSGQATAIAPGEPDLGAVGNVVVRLCRPIPRNVKHIVYFDNFYTSIPLLHYLKNEGILSVGTVQRNRLGQSCKLPSKADLMKSSVPRGKYEEQVVDYEDVEISAIVWKDNKPVMLASTYVGAEPVETITRYDKKQKKQTTIQCPQIVKHYNAHMGGVDLMDSFLGRYKIRIKSRKWYMLLFYHLIDLAVINSWVLYKKVNEKRGNSKTITLADFRSELANTLCNYKTNGESKRGRPSSSNIERELEAKKRRGPMKYVPPKDVGTDGVGHHEKRCENKNRCKLPGCKGFSRTECTKCKVTLCHTKDRNCFATFHQ